MNRKLLWAVLGIGVALVVTPFAMSLPTKAAAGQRMMNGFQPIMQPAQVQATDDYEPLVTAVQANADNYREANSLPDFRL